MASVVYEELLQRDGRVVTHVVGFSMRPLLLNRESIVVVEDAALVPPGPGDVVLYKAGDTYTLHRVLREEPGGFVIRGDNTWVLEHVPREALLATMTGFYRHPRGRFISREDAAYRLYRLALPLIRWVRRQGGRLRHLAGRLVFRITAAFKKSNK